MSTQGQWRWNQKSDLISEWVSEWVTRSPIELSWTAKNLTKSGVNDLVSDNHCQWSDSGPIKILLNLKTQSRISWQTHHKHKKNHFTWSYWPHCRAITGPSEQLLLQNSVSALFISKCDWSISSKGVQYLQPMQCNEANYKIQDIIDESSIVFA